MLAGRPRDIEDIESVMIKNAGIDTSYIKKWLGEFDSALDRSTLSEFRSLLARLRRPFLESVGRGVSDAKAGKAMSSATLKQKLREKKKSSNS
jgi:hypothetical protein